jgi:hypothetical protein
LHFVRDYYCLSGTTTVCQGLLLFVRDYYYLSTTICQGLLLFVRDYYYLSGTTTVCQGLLLFVRDYYYLPGTTTICQGLLLFVRDCCLSERLFFFDSVLTSNTDFFSLSFPLSPSPAPPGNDPARANIVVPDLPEAVEDVAAVKLQKIARGKLGKNYVKRRRIRYHLGATRIQAGFRGRRARVSTRRRMMERDAAVHIQRTVRGRLGRKKANRVRRARLQRLAATDMVSDWE